MCNHENVYAHTLAICMDCGEVVGDWGEDIISEGISQPTSGASNFTTRIDYVLEGVR